MEYILDTMAPQTILSASLFQKQQGAFIPPLIFFLVVSKSSIYIIFSKSHAYVKFNVCVMYEYVILLQ